MNSSKPVEPTQSQPGTRPLNIADIGMRYDGMIGAVRFDDAKPAKSGPHWTIEIELESTEESLVNQLLAGTFNENIESHAENLAERLIQRQQELDRRESQLNRFAADIENRQRQVRMHQAEPVADPAANGTTAQPSENSLATLPMQEEVSADKQRLEPELVSGARPESEREQLSHLQNVDSETLLHRIDRYHAAENRTSSIVHKRLKKLARNARQEKVVARMQRAIFDGHQPDLNLDSAQVAIPFPESDPSTTPPPLKPQPASSTNTITRSKPYPEQPKAPALVQLPDSFSISELTKRISAVRKRTEEIDRMYDDLTLIFTETLRQQSKLRAIVDEVQAGGRRVTVATLNDARLKLDRLTVQLTRVGREHFLLPPGTEAA